MRNLLSFLLLVLVALSCSRCKNGSEDEGTKVDFKVNFRAFYGGQPLERYKLYDYADYRVQFTRFHTYLSDIALIKQDGKTVNISDIDFVNFTPDNSSNNLSPTVPLTFSVPEGEYTGMVLGYGVKPDLNSKQPKDFKGDHPLALENEYWLGWKSYIFTKIEGNGFTDPDNRPDFPLLYHLGSDPVFRRYNFAAPIKVGAGASCTVDIDLKKLFTMQDKLFDLKNPDNQTTSHVKNDVRIAVIVADNLDAATVVQ